MEGSPPFIAAAVVLSFYLGHLVRCRLRKERQAARDVAFRERVRVPRENGGLDLSLQEQSRPFRTWLWLQMNYPPGSIADQAEPREGWRVHVNV